MQYSPAATNIAVNMASQPQPQTPYLTVDQIDAHLHEFIWGRADVLNAMHCQANLFNNIARRDILCIALTQGIREKYWEGIIRSGFLWLRCFTSPY